VTQLSEFWKTWGNLLVLLINIAFFTLAVLMRVEMQDYIRTQLREFVTTARFEEYKQEHEKWGNERLVEIHRQLQKAETDRLRAETKLDRLMERGARP
jgi:hypothetical protein